MNETAFAPARDEALKCLQSLVEIGRDANEGFAHSANQATDPGLKTLLHQYAMERATMVDELQQLQVQHGQSGIDDSGSVTGTLHRAWINLRSAVSSHHDLAILEEVERGEDAAVAAYREALEPREIPLPRSITAVLEHQLQKIKAAHDELRQRREAARAAAALA